MKFRPQLSMHRRNISVFTLSLFLFVAAPLFAGGKYGVTNRLDGIALLSPPPVPGSVEHAADMTSARAVFTGRTAAQEDRANKDASLTLFNFTPAIGKFFKEGKFPKLEQFYQDLKPEIKETITVPKTHWKRQRPYEIDPALSLGKPETSFSYPSGHSAVGTVQSFLLAELFPEKRDAILEIGRNIGWDRVVIGKHFPTDVYAGRVLGQAIFRELMASPAFQHDLAELKAEIKSVRPTKLEETKASP